MGGPQKSKTELLYDPGSPFLERNEESWRDICTSLFTVAFSSLAKIWKQPKCISTDEQRKTGVYIRWNIIWF